MHRIFRWIIRLVVLLMVAAAIFWWASPAWVPSLAMHWLPAGWQLLELDIERPGFRRLTASRVVANGTLKGFEIRITAEGMTFSAASGPAIIGKATVEKATMLIETRGTNHADDLSKVSEHALELFLPEALLGLALPGISIQQLDIIFDTPSGEYPLAFDEVNLHFQNGQMDLRASIENLPFLLTKGDLVVEAGANEFQLSVELQDQISGFSESPGRMTVRQNRVSDGTGGEVQTAFDTDFSVVDIPAVQQLIEVRPGFEWPRVFGRAKGSARFDAMDWLSIVVGELELADVELIWPSGRVDGFIDLAVVREDGEITVMGNDLDLRSSGRWPFAVTVIEQLSAELGITGVMRDVPQSWHVTSSGLEGRIPLNNENLVTARGDLNLVWEQSDGAAVKAQFGSFKLESGAHPQSLSVTGNTTIESTFPDVFRIDLDAGHINALVLTSVFTGDYHFAQQQLIAIEGQLVSLTADSIHLSQGGLELGIDSLSTEGEIKLDQSVIEFRGPVTGVRLDTTILDDQRDSTSMLADSLNSSLRVKIDEQMLISGDLELSGVDMPESGLTSGSVQLALNEVALDPLAGKITLLTSGLEAAMNGSIYRGMDVDLEASLHSNALMTGSGELLLGYSAAVPVSFTAHPERSDLTVMVREAEIPAAGIRDALRVLGEELPDALAIQSGRVDLSAEIRMVEQAGGAAIEGFANVHARELSLSLGESRLSDLSFQTDVDLATLKGEGSMSTRLIQLAGGIDVNDLAMQTRFADTSRFTATNVSARLLDGALAMPEIALSDGKLSDTLISLTSFDLGLLIQAFDVAGLSATGRLDAQLPVVATPQGLSVESGRFEAKVPGRLSYSTGVPATNIGLQALENFHYDSFAGDFDYAADGQYTLVLRLLGKNPDLYGGHPIRFTLTLGGELPEMFRSLFVTGDFDRALIEQMRTNAGELEPATDLEP